MTFPSLRQFSKLAQSRETGIIHLNKQNKPSLDRTATLGQHNLRLPNHPEAIFSAFTAAVYKAGYSSAAVDRLQTPHDGMSFTPKWLREQFQRLETHTDEAIRHATRPNADEVDKTTAIDLIINNRLGLPKNPAVDLIRPMLSQGINEILDSVTAMDRSDNFQLLTETAKSLANTLLDTTTYAFDALTYGDNRPSFTKQEVAAMVKDLQTAIPDQNKTVATIRTNMNRDLQVQTEQFVANINTMMTNLRQDLPAVNERFFAGQADDAQGLTGLSITDSDPHKNGQRVAILTFDNGQKIVFKPRDARIDEAVVGRNLENGQKSALELMEESRPNNENQRPLPGMTFLHKNSGKEDAYSYQTHLSSRTAADHLLDSPEAAKAYFHEMGTLAFAASLAGATDLHHENLMTSKGQPFLTDLEIAGSTTVTGALRDLLNGAQSDIMPDTMLNKVFADKGTRIDNPPPFKVTDQGLTKQGGRSMVVLESVVAVKHHGEVRDNRETNAVEDYKGFNNKANFKTLGRMFSKTKQATISRSPDHSFSTTYGADFARGFTEAARNFPVDKLAEFHERISGFKMRMHPLPTGFHQIKVAGFRQDIASPAEERREKIKNSYENDFAKTRTNLGTRALNKPLDKETKTAMANQFADQVTNFDVPYNSHVPNQGAMGFDQTGPAVEGIFKPANLHTAELVMSLTEFQNNEQLARRVETNLAQSITSISEQPTTEDQPLRQLRAEIQERAGLGRPANPRDPNAQV